jgi:pimeloyl-ACP methyl ester carboxylesterase
VSGEKSTNGRTKSYATVPAPLRFAFRVLERVAPQVGARLAVRYWFTVPSRARRPRRSEAGLPPADRFTVDLHGCAVRGTAWGAGPTVYLVHGWGGWGEQLASYVNPLIAAGYRVVAFDAPSHGASAPGRHGPRSTALPEMADALRAVVAAQGEPHAFVAHSIGAMAVALVLRDGVDAERVVLLAPAATVGPMMPVFRAAFGFGDRIQVRMHARIEAYAGLPMAELDVPAIGRRLHAQGRLPQLFTAHDAQDSQTPHQGSFDIAEAWQAQPPMITTGLSHNRIVHSAEVTAAAVEFLIAPGTVLLAGERSAGRVGDGD